MPSLSQPITLTTPDGATISGLRCGHGPIPLLVIPGAGDGLFTARDSALSLALYFWPRRHTYTITYLSRRDPIPPGFTLRDHARDFHWALTQLHWGPGLIEANSGGGPIGQLLAAETAGDRAHGVHLDQPGGAPEVVHPLGGLGGVGDRGGVGHGEHGRVTARGVDDSFSSS